MLAISEITQEAIALKPLDKIRLVDNLLYSLQSTTSEVDEAWIQESENRIDDYNNGKLKSKPSYEVFAKYDS